MTRDLRWRIITLQVIVIVLFAFSAAMALWAHNFTHDQVTSQLAPQQISFPKDQASGLFPDLQQYAGQQVLTGDQAHAYAEQFIARHLQSIGTDKATGQSHPYSYWSGLALSEKDPTKKAAYNATADTLFKGETLRTMLDQAWAFWTVGDIALFLGIGLIIAALAVLAALIFEAVVAPKRATEPGESRTVATAVR